MSKRKQLTAEDWLKQGLETLDNEGIHKVNVEYLAGQLGVTKGSFYWHFKNHKTLIREMLDYWARTLTTNVIERSIQDSKDAKEVFFKLITIITTEKIGRYEAAMRAYARHDGKARSTIQKVDQQRLQYITGLFTDMNFKQADAEVRARLALYYQVAEQGIFLKDSKKKRDDLLKQRFNFLTTHHESIDKPGC
jgi:AcrR family transcriptional regulator